MAKKIDPMWDDNPIDVSSEVNFIWSIANQLRGAYKADHYQDVIIPMTIIRRFECALEATKKEVVDTFQKNPSIAPKMLCKKSGFSFYNTSKFTLSELCNDPQHIVENFISYIDGFSANIQDILNRLKFAGEIDAMAENNRLYTVVKSFSELELDPATVDSMKMGYIFEELIRKFSENADAGDHYTGRDIIKVMVSILLSEGADDVLEPGKVTTIIDQACGTGGMLSTAYNFIRRFNPDADIRLFGQENNPQSYAMCLAEMLIKGQNAENIVFQDTMFMDRFPNTQMRFVLENPPFGEAWGGKDAPEGCEAAVIEEYNKGIDASRWGAGLPGSGDMQMLFLQSAMHKLADNGRAAIIEDGSPLFVGGTSSGESQIRRWFLENDYIEAIIALPSDLFYNTGIATYIWVLSKNKREERKGKVQLIDASSISHKLRKPLGNKKNEIKPEDRKKITELYTNFAENDLCRIYDTREFLYREYTVMQPLQRSYAINRERIEMMLQTGVLNSFFSQAKLNELENAESLSAADEKTIKKFRENHSKFELIMKTLMDNESNEVYLSPDSFRPILQKALGGVLDKKDKLWETIEKGLSMMDKSAELQHDKHGELLYDPETKDTEIVGFLDDIDSYMEREVLPHVPDAKAFFEEDLAKKKPVIKTGAEIPFTRYFYKYQEPTSSAKLAKQFEDLETSVASHIQSLFA